MVKGNPTANGCPDADSDTVPDDVDRCPNQKGIPALGGCPDSDGDSVPDLDDKCPMVVGVVALNGCPDKDGDGVGDKDDRCPDEPGPPALAGCPDNDKDGIENAADRCPDQPGTAELQGCPDKDGDTVADVDDRCPADPGVPALKGCPDRDSDNIADLDDKCPDAAGPPERQGCPKPKAIPKAIEKKFSGALPGIYFKTGSAEILSKSFPVLNDAAKALLEYPTLRVRIEGHTDDRGGRSYNQKLSENRAKSVAAYLTAQGVAPIRMQTVGLGEDKPAATNRTAAGRAQNRRIEFHIISR